MDLVGTAPQCYHCQPMEDLGQNFESTCYRKLKPGEKCDVGCTDENLQVKAQLFTCPSDTSSY